MRGKIIHRQRAAQIRDFGGLRYGNITPTDIDGLIEYKDKLFIFFELKCSGVDLPYGQALAIQRICDSLNKPSIAFVANHDTPLDQDIDTANAIVCSYYWHGRWCESPGSITLKTAIDGFISKQA